MMASKHPHRIGPGGARSAAAPGKQGFFIDKAGESLYMTFLWKTICSAIPKFSQVQNIHRNNDHGVARGGEKFLISACFVVE
jgi:hypothetical protein